jgi:GTP:adenosylcobinamide-phosphate guanylyltransferase
VIAAISHAASQSFESTATSQIVKTRQKRWNFADIDFFDSNFDEKFAFTNEALIHADKNTYYKDVHVFVERIKKMIIVLELDMIRKNLLSCLRDFVLMWHTIELSNVFKRILSYDENVDEWV